MSPPRDERAPLLEAWYRDHLPSAAIDISASGVEAYPFGELRRLLELSSDELDEVRLDDSTTLGAAALREAIARRYAAGDLDRVMATHGSSEAISLILSVLLRPGERVVVVDPIYHSLRSYAELTGSAITRVPVDAFTAPATRASGWGELIERGTAAVVVNFPHNPTGQSLCAAGVQQLARRCAEVGAFLVWDGAMEELTMTGDAAVWVPEAEDHVIRFGTLSKAFGLPGLRVGWCIAPREVLARTMALRDRTTLFLSPLIERIATRAIARADVLIAPRLARARHNLALLDAWIAEHGDLVTWQLPTGGVCGLLELRGVDDTEPFCRHLVADTGVLLVPGRAFERPSAVRISYGGDSDALREALRRLSSFLHRNAASRIAHRPGRGG
jgi:capreomycidine synthase